MFSPLIAWERDSLRSSSIFVHVSCVFEIRAHSTCGLVVEEFNSTKVVFDPFSEDGVFLSSVGQFTLHAPTDIGIESEEEIE